MLDRKTSKKRSGPSAHVKTKAKSKPSPYRYTFAIALLWVFLLTVEMINLYNNNEISQNFLLSSTSITVSLLFSLSVFTYLLFRGKSFREIMSSFGLTREKLTSRNLFIGIALFFGVIALEILVAEFSQITNIPLPTNVDQLLAGMPLYFYIFAIFIAPVNEEIFFRAFLVPRIGIILSAIVFAVFHAGYGSVSELFGTLIFGLIAGYIFKRTGSVYSSLFAHICVNLLAISALIAFSSM